MSYCRGTTHLSLLGLLLSAAIGCQNAAAEDATAYQDACGGCHPAPASLAPKIRGDTEAEKKAYLTALLTRHHPPDQAAADGIIDFLLTLPKR